MLRAQRCPGTHGCQGSGGTEGLTGGAVGPKVSRPCAVTLISCQADPHAHPLVLAGVIATRIHCGEREMSPSITVSLCPGAPCSPWDDAAPNTAETDAARLEALWCVPLRCDALLPAASMSLSPSLVSPTCCREMAKRLCRSQALPWPSQSQTCSAFL